MWRAASTLIFAAAAVAFTALASPATAAVTINYAGVNLYSFVNVGAPSVDGAITDIQSWGGDWDFQPGLNNLSSEVHLSVQSIKKGTLLASANLDQYANLTPLSGNEWIFQTSSNASRYTSSSGNFAQSGGRYDMRANYSVNTPSILKIFYEIDQDFQSNSSLDASISFYNSNIPSTKISGNGSGTLSFNMTPGIEYYLSVEGQHQRGDPTGTTVGLFSNSLNHKYRFLIVPASVPEPGTWAMMLVGFSALGMGLRRSRASARRFAH